MALRNNSITGGFSSNTTMSQIIHKHQIFFLNQKYIKLSWNKMNKRRPLIQNRRLVIQNTVIAFSQLTPEKQNDCLIATMHTCGNA